MGIYESDVLTLNLRITTKNNNVEYCIGINIGCIRVENSVRKSIGFIFSFWCKILTTYRQQISTGQILITISKLIDTVKYELKTLKLFIGFYLGTYLSFDYLYSIYYKKKLVIGL